MNNNRWGIDVKPHKIYLDLSEIAFRDAKTGIQRVVKNVIKEWVSYDKVDYSIAPICARPSEGYCPAIDYIASLLKENSVPSIIEDAEGCSLQEASFGDIYFMLDFQPRLVPKMRNLYQTLSNKGVRVVFLVYDILPIQFPQFFTPGFADAFCDWLNTVLEVSDKVISISQSTMNSILNYIEKNPSVNISSSLEHQWFHIGVDFPQHMTAAQHIPSQLCEKKTALFLMVGTIEPRKGHADVLDVFEKLYSTGSSPRLVVIGKKGWGCDELISRFVKFAACYEQFIWLDNAQDEILLSCYEQANYVIAASYGEGYGLPIVEAAYFGCKVICRNIPVFREVAGNIDVTYFNNNDDLYNVIKTACDAPTQPSKTISSCLNLKTPDVVDWQTSSLWLYHAVINSRGR